MTINNESYLPYINSEENWQELDGSNNLIEQLTLGIDESTGNHTCLTRFKPGADTSQLSTDLDTLPDEIFIISGKLYDIAAHQWLLPGDYISRSADKKLGPFKTDSECTTLVVTYPKQISIEF